MPNASVIRRAGGQTKPPPGAQIDRGHPLARELSVCVLDYTDLVSGAPALPQAAIVSAGPGGLGWRLSGQATQGISFAVPTGTISTGTRQFTLRAVYTTQTWVNLANIAGFGNAVTSTNGGGPATRSILNNSAATSYNYWDDNVNVGFTGTSVATIGVTDVIYAYDGTNLRCYVNGAQVGAATSLNGLAFTATDLFWIGGRHSAGSTTITGWVYAANYWNRKLTFDEIEWLAAEPYAFLVAPGPRAIYYIGATAASVSGDATVSGSGAISATGTVTRSGDGTLGGTGTLATSGTVTRIGDATLAGTGALSGSGIVTRSGDAALSGTGVLVGAGTVTRIGDLTLTGSGTISASGVRTVIGGDTITGGGEIGATGTVTRSGDATLSGLGLLAAQGTVTVHGNGTISGSGVLTGSAATEGVLGCIDLTVAPTGTVDLDVNPTGSLALALAPTGSIDITIEECVPALATVGLLTRLTESGESRLTEDDFEREIN